MKKTSVKSGRPVTLSILNSTLDKAFKRFGRGLDKRFDQIDRKFDLIDRKFELMADQFAQIDKRFAVVEGKLAAYVGINTMNIDRAINALEERQNKKFDVIISRMDAFLNRTEVNEREITFLGKQHDNLAKYCHEKIAYPEYGRML